MAGGRAGGSGAARKMAAAEAAERVMDDHDGWASDGEVEDVEMEVAGEVHGHDADQRDGGADDDEDDAYSLVSI